MIRPSHHIVVFLNSGRRQWWDIFVGRGLFTHCLTLSSFQDGYVMFNWQAGKAEVAVMSREEAAKWLHHVVDKWSGVYFHVPASDAAPPHRMPFLYCVESVKQLIGLRCWWAVTPTLLYHALIERGLEGSHALG